LHFFDKSFNVYHKNATNPDPLFSYKIDGKLIYAEVRGSSIRMLTVDKDKDIYFIEGKINIRELLEKHQEIVYEDIIERMGERRGSESPKKTKKNINKSLKGLIKLLTWKEKNKTEEFIQYMKDNLCYNYFQLYEILSSFRIQPNDPEKIDSLAKIILNTYILNPVISFSYDIENAIGTIASKVKNNEIDSLLFTPIEDYIVNKLLEDLYPQFILERRTRKQKKVFSYTQSKRTNNDL